MPCFLKRGGAVPRSLISKRVKIPPVLFTRQTFFHKESLKGEPYTGNPYVRFDEGTEVERPPPTLRGWGLNK